MSFLTTNDGTTLFFKDWGTGKPVVFVHACGMNAAFWDYTTPFLHSKGLRCVTYDLRGHGRSDDPGHGYNYDRLVDDLHCLLEELDLRDVTLVGHSMGGGLVTHYVARHGGAGRVSKLALLGSPDCLQLTDDNPEGIEQQFFDQALAIMAGDYPQWLLDNVGAFYLPETFGVSEGIINWTINLMFHTSMQAFIECQQACFGTDLREEISRITIPALVIHGDKDASIPFRCGQANAARMSGSILKVYPDAPHGLIVSHKDQVNADLLDFVQGNSAR